MLPEVPVVEDARRCVPIMDELHKQGVASPYSRSPSPASSHTNLNSSRVLSDFNVARSAFEITSVSDAPPEAELEVEGVAVTSRDAEELQQSVQEAMRDATATPPDASRGGQQRDEESSSATPVASTDNSAATSNSASPKIAHLVHQTSVAASSNGPSQLVRSRFLRVTCYNRGRWNGKDTCEPEERPESELKMAVIPSTSRSSSDRPAPNSPPTSSRRALLPMAVVENIPMLSLRSRAEPSNLLHGHGNNEAVALPTESRDAPPQLDRISVAAESTHSLSRTASLLSVAKLDEEERERENDQESVISFAPSTQTPDLVATEAQLTSVERPSQLCTCSDCLKGPQDRTAKEQQKLLGEALNHLREQLSQCDSYLKVMQERNRLHEERNRLQEENSRLRDLLAIHGVNVSLSSLDTGQEHS